MTVVYCGEDDDGILIVQVIETSNPPTALIPPLMQDIKITLLGVDERELKKTLRQGGPGRYKLRCGQWVKLKDTRAGNRKTTYGQKSVKAEGEGA